MINLMVRCRSGGNSCVVTEEKRKCISCRYDKCIKAGMKVKILNNAVMVDFYPTRILRALGLLLVDSDVSSPSLLVCGFQQATRNRNTRSPNWYILGS